MPTTTVQPIQGYAHCRNPRCPGSRQERVEAVRIEDSYTYVERGGDLPGFENSNVRVRFANDGWERNDRGEPTNYDESQDDTPCPTCRRARDITNEPRPSYEALSGFDQDGLLDIEINASGSRFDPAKSAEIQAEASETLKAENAELRERLAKLEGFMLGKEAE